MTIPKAWKIDHIVVLARNKKREYIHYQCHKVEDIRPILPVKIFVNGFDFTHKLTLKSRLTKYSLNYVITHIWTTTFRRIANHFRELHTKIAMAQKYSKAKIKKKTTHLQTLEAYIGKQASTSGVTDTPATNVKPKLKSNSKNQTGDAKLSKESHSMSAVPFSYDELGLNVQEAKIKKYFGRAYLIYLQLILNKLRQQYPDLPSVAFDFDHSIFAFLFEHDLKSEDELTAAVERVLRQYRFPDERELKWTLTSMTRLRRVLVSVQGATRSLTNDEIDDVVGTILSYFDTLATALETPPDVKVTAKRKPAKSSPSRKKRRRN